MTREVDFISKSLEALIEIHSKLCAEANDLGVSLPEKLTVDFDSQERGSEICTELNVLIDAARGKSGLADGGEVVHSASDAPPKKKAAKKAKPADVAKTTSNGVSQMTSKTKTTKTAKKAKATKKVAKKKVAAAKSGTAKKTKVPRGDSLTSKVVALMKRAKGVTRAEVLELTGWKAVSMQQLAKSAGIKMKVSEDRPFHYMAA